MFVVGVVLSSSSFPFLCVVVGGVRACLHVGFCLLSFAALLCMLVFLVVGTFVISILMVHVHVVMFIVVGVVLVLEDVRDVGVDVVVVVV